MRPKTRPQIRQKTISTDRFFLIPFSKADLADLHNLNKDPEVMKFIREPEKNMQVSLVSLDRMLSHAQNNPGLGFWKIIEKDSKSFVGWAGILPLESTGEYELGYRLKKEYWGQEIAVEASFGVLEYIHSEKLLDKIVAVVDPRNTQSLRVMEKLNFEKIGKATHYNKEVEKFVFSLTGLEAKKINSTSNPEILATSHENQNSTC